MPCPAKFRSAQARRPIRPPRWTSENQWAERIPAHRTHEPIHPFIAEPVKARHSISVNRYTRSDLPGAGSIRERE